MDICNILIIEDDAFQCKILNTMLSSMSNAKVVNASNGKEGLAAIEKQKPDVIFCDLYMPEMDGVEFVRVMSEMDIQTTVVFTSSAASDVQAAVIEMSRSYGLKKVANLIKPLKREQVSQLLDWVAKDTLPTHSKQRPTFNISENDLKLALRGDQFEPYYQAHFEAKTGKLIGAEALIRWNHPQFGLLTPIHFLDQLFSMGLSYQLTCHMLRKSVETAMTWHNRGWPLNISVNVTPTDLVQPDFANRILQIVDEVRFPPHRLTLEVTETELASDLAKSLENTSRLRIRGVNISIDDFGTGHSSLSQLISSPFTELKIDQTFVSQMMENNKHLAAVRCVISLSKSLDLRVVAEGVENQSQARRLAQLGCDVLQGYYLAKPKSSNHFAQFCSKHFSKARHIQTDQAVT
ncbi:two-component system response regulator [Vibrio fortis]|uniref:two-component system response regulator n=1 Tax=Vibrio fortis TaxID=212667 RepID=UPI0021C3CC61|nr:EAL domain-containing response regulator [Vibrio fortis]